MLLFIVAIATEPQAQHSAIDFQPFTLPRSLFSALCKLSFIYVCGCEKQCLCVSYCTPFLCIRMSFPVLSSTCLYTSLYLCVLAGEKQQ